MRLAKWTLLSGTTMAVIAAVFFIDKPGSSSTRQSPFYTVRHPKGYRHLALQ